MTIPSGPYGTLQNGIRYDGTPYWNILRTQATNTSRPSWAIPKPRVPQIVPLAWMPLQVPEARVVETVAT